MIGLDIFCVVSMGFRGLSNCFVNKNVADLTRDVIFADFPFSSYFLINRYTRHLVAAASYLFRTLFFPPLVIVNCSVNDETNTFPTFFTICPCFSEVVTSLWTRSCIRIGPLICGNDVQ